jgi:hypothetical protein
MDEGRLNSLEAEILRILDGHQGKEDAIGRFALVDCINAENPLFPFSERTVRKTIKHLITQHGFAIGSGGGKNGGYYMCETPDEIEKVTRYFDCIGLSSLFTSSKLKKIEMRDYLGQLSMRFGG